MASLPNNSPQQQTTDTPIIAASYERVSTRRQGQHGFSLGAQRLTLEEFALQNHWDLPDHLRFRDGENENASGTDWNLPGLTAMMEAASRHEFTVLVVPDLDRFARSLVKGLVLEEQLSKYGVRVAYQRVPVDDSPEGRLLKNQLFSFAEFEREKTRLRSMIGRREKARRGQVVGLGPAPYGYRYLKNELGRNSGFELDPMTAPIVQQIFASLATKSLIEVQRDLNEDGIPSPGGCKWGLRALASMARDSVYMGEWLYGKESENPATAIVVPVVPIVDRILWRDVQDALTRRRVVRRGRLPRDEDPYLLRSILTCGNCHQPLISETITGTRYYNCPTRKPSRARRNNKPVCDLPSIRAQDLEEELFRALSATLLDEERLAAGLEAQQQQYEEGDTLRRERLAALDTEASRQRRRLDQLAVKLIDAGDGEVYAALLRQAKGIEELVQRLDSERDKLKSLPTQGMSPSEALAIREFAASIRFGLAHATPAERRHVYEVLRICGTVHVDPDGLELSRNNTFRIEWGGKLQLGDSMHGSHDPSYPGVSN